MDQLNNQHEEHVQPLILIVDDEEVIVKTLGDMLQDDGYRVVGTSNPHEVISLVGELIPDIVLMDVFMPGFNGIDLLLQLKKEYPRQIVIMLSGYGNIPIALDALKAGASDFIEKPFSINEVIKKIKQCLTVNGNVTDVEKTQLIIEQARRYGLVGQSPLFLEFLQQVAIAGSLTLPLIIYGPSGVGKRSFVNFIHSLRVKNNLVTIDNSFVIDCSMLPTFDDFKLNLASAKNIFLYNINLLPYEYQHHLVTYYYSYNFILYATATESLYRAMQQGVIIPSLYEIMHAMPLEIPALQKRAHDIPFLVDHYLTVLESKKYEKISIEQLALRALCNHEWKKNITELELVIKQCIADSFLHDGVITLPIVQKYLLRVDTTLIEEQLYHQYISFDEAVLSFEKKFLLYHLKKNRYDLETVSHKTKLNVLQLQNKLAALDIVLKK